MRPLRWTSSRSVFLPQIDAEHRSLYRLANELQSSLLAHAPEERVREAIRAFLADLEEHFAHEERLMRSTGYEIYDWHKRRHDGARRRIGNAVKEFENGDREALVELIEYLDGWFRDHTALADRMMSTYLRNYERRAAVS
jgi:hemerythrin-like metal-binding protein